MQEMQIQSLCWEDPLEKGMEIHSSILAWRIPWTEDPGGLQSMGVTKELDMTELLTTESYLNSEPQLYFLGLCGFEQVALFGASFHMCKIRLKSANESHIKGCQGDSMR